MMWESSRMILPEHKIAMNRQSREAKRKPRPQFDEQFVEEVSQFLVEAHYTRKPVNVRMYDEYDDAYVIGVIERLDTLTRRFMVDGEWFHVVDVLAFEYASDTK